jgi:hypothetical protein
MSHPPSAHPPAAPPTLSAGASLRQTVAAAPVGDKQVPAATLQEALHGSRRFTELSDGNTWELFEWFVGYYDKTYDTADEQQAR